MALIEHDLFGNVNDKVKRAIEIARSFEPPEGYYLAYSGGKDSQVVKAILDMAGVKCDVHYNVTTVDPPELVRFIIGQFDAVIYDLQDGNQRTYTTHGSKKLLTPTDSIDGNIIHFTIPAVPMRKLIVQKKVPPTRLMRYCCDKLKEVNGVGRIVVTGARWSESAARRDGQGRVTIFNGKNAKPIAQEVGADFKETKRGGIVMNYDDSAARRTVELCYRTNKTLINPIVDFTDDDIWEFIRTNNIPYCSLYDEGWKRLGCVGCPLGNVASQRREFERWPQYRKMYVSTFDRMMEVRRREGLMNSKKVWTDGESVMRWWTECDQGNNPDQMRIEEFE